jgi:HAD superfamily hydrolase (TIGR01509 family)
MVGMSKIKGILLDIDGTLVLSNDAHAQAWVRAFEQNNYQVSFESVRRLIGMGSDRILPTLVPGLTKESEAGQNIVNAHKDAFMSEAVPTLKPAPGSRELVERLQGENFKLMAASSANPEQLEALLDVAGVRTILTEATSPEEVESSKPAPDIVHASLDKLGLSADEVVMIGDTIYDLEAARGAGVGLIAVRCGGYGDEDFDGALAVYDDPADLLAHWDESPLKR